MIAFTKMEALGNDFVVLYKPTFDYQVSLPRIANRRYGVGCDQIIVLEDSCLADVRVRFFNQDGSEAKMCGNGLRAVIRFLRKSAFIETNVGIVYGWVEKSHISILIGAPRRCNKHVLGIPGFEKYQIVNIGNSHCIVAVESDITDDQLKKHGQYIESYFSDGINVSFVRYMKPGHIRLRVWERGVGITLACGSAAAAACVDLPVGESCVVHLDGGMLICRMTKKGLIQTGPASFCFCGVYYDDTAHST